ncbi:ArgE/DapE family deacylase [Alcaligenes sp. Marseille-Q7550]
MPHRETIKSKLSNLIDASHGNAITHLTELVRTPSDNPPGDCAPIARVAAAQLRQLGFEVELHEVDPQTTARAGMQSVINLVVRERFGDGPVIALNAHGDVVPPGLGWTVDPYKGEQRDGWLFGRGAAVSKSDFVTYAYALRALKQSGARLKGTVELHFTFDEETGGLLGPGWLLEQGIVKPDYVICAAFSYNVIIAHNGCLHLEARVRGKSAHAAAPHTGHDAIEATSALLNAFYRYRDSLNQIVSSTPGIASPTCVVGLIKGGINTNVVADEVVLRIDRRIIPEESPAQVEQDLRQVLAEALKDMPGIQLEVDQILLARPLAPTAASAAFAETLARNAQDIMGEPIAAAMGIPLYTDARLYSENGIPTIMYGAGPRDLLEANGHRADERVPLDTINKAAKVIAYTLLDMLDDSGAAR